MSDPSHRPPLANLHHGVEQPSSSSGSSHDGFFSLKWPAFRTDICYLGSMEEHKRIIKKILRAGFTLLELLIVMVIIALLAGLAMPVYQQSIEKARGQEALRHLNATRDSLLRYYVTNSTYTGATMGGTLDYDPNPNVGGQTQIFSYGFSVAPNADVFELRATRTAIIGCGPAPVGTILLDQAGSVTGTGVYA